MKIRNTPPLLNPVFLKKTRTLATPPILWEKSESPSPKPFRQNF